MMDETTEIRRSVILSCLNENAANSLCFVRSSLEVLELYMMKNMPAPVAQECTKLLQDVNGQLNYLHRIMSNAADMVESCMGQLNVCVQAMPITGLLYNLCQEANLELERRDFAGRVMIDPPMEEALVVRGDPVMAENTLVNLITGQLRLGGGKGELTIGLECADRVLHMDFWQAGSAMPEPVLRAVEQADAESCRQLTEKEGLGFWLASAYCRSMGWEIAAENEPRGCVVRLQIPLEKTGGKALLRSEELRRDNTINRLRERMQCEFAALFS